MIRNKVADGNATVPTTFDEDLWDVARAARFLGMSVSWTYRAAEAGQLPYRRIGSRLRFLPAELRSWLDGRAGKAA